MVDRIIASLERLDIISPMPFVANLTPAAATLLFRGDKDLASQRFVLIFAEDDSWYAFNSLGMETEMLMLSEILPQGFSKVKRQQVVSLELAKDALAPVKSEPKRTTAVI